jgi:hypothetical protein
VETPDELETLVIPPTPPMPDAEDAEDDDDALDETAIPPAPPTLLDDMALDAPPTLLDVLVTLDELDVIAPVVVVSPLDSPLDEAAPLE